MGSVANCNYKCDLWWAVNYLYTQDFPLACDVWKEIRGRANTTSQKEREEGGNWRGKREKPTTTKKTQFIAEMYLIFIYTQHSTADWVSQKGPALCINDIYSIKYIYIFVYTYIYSIHIYSHMSRVSIAAHKFINQIKSRSKLNFVTWADARGLARIILSSWVGSGGRRERVKRGE